MRTGDKRIWDLVQEVEKQEYRATVPLTIAAQTIRLKLLKLIREELFSVQARVSEAERVFKSLQTERDSAERFLRRRLPLFQKGDIVYCRYWGAKKGQFSICAHTFERVDAIDPKTGRVRKNAQWLCSLSSAPLANELPGLCPRKGPIVKVRFDFVFTKAEHMQGKDLILPDWARYE